MRRAKIGDVYAFKTECGYRILHWAYKIEKHGNYVRVFRGFYDSVPLNIQEIVDGDCEYILNFSADKLYRKGVLQWCGNHPISEAHPFPTHDIHYLPFTKDSGEFEICEVFCHQHYEKFAGDHTGNGLPDKYADLKLINGVVDPISFLCLLASDFDMQHWDLFWSKEKWNEYAKRYGDLLF